MDTQELYELLSKQITEMDARFTKQFESLDARLESLDARLRNVEVDVAAIKGQRFRSPDIRPHTGYAVE